MKLNLKFRLIALILLTVISIPVFSQKKEITSFEGGSKKKFGDFSLLDLHGSYRQMGRQYGKLMSSELQEIYQLAIEEHFIKEKKITFDSLYAVGYQVYRLYPQRFKEIMLGMAEQSGLSLEQHIALNTIEWYDFMCSAVGAWNQYTVDKRMIFGRNYDYPEHFKKYSKFLTIAVFHPTDLACATAIITWAGTIYATTGVNDKGIYMELNNGGPSGGDFIYANRIPTEIMLFAFLLDSWDFYQMDSYFNTTLSSFSFIPTVATKDFACTYEWPTFGLKRINDTSGGLIVATNYFSDPSWAIITPSVEYSLRRRTNLIKLANDHKGKIDVEVMKKIFGVSYEDGGALNLKKTIWQMVFVPETFEFWLKANDVQDWTVIPLSDYLENKPLQ